MGFTLEGMKIEKKIKERMGNYLSLFTERFIPQ